MEDVAAYAETLSLKDEVVKSLSSQLVDYQSTDGQQHEVVKSLSSQPADYQSTTCGQNQKSSTSLPTSPNAITFTSETSCHVERLQVLCETLASCVHIPGDAKKTSRTFACVIQPSGQNE